MTPHSFLVLSSRHNLHPLASRLRVEGHHVELVIERTRYERAWRGRLSPTLVGKDKDLPERWQALVAGLTDPIVVEDSTKLTKTFARACGGTRRGYYTPDPVSHAGAGSMVRVGWWWDGERAHAPHVMVEDRGAHPGAMGPDTVGAVTLVRLGAVPDGITLRLNPSVRGLVSVPVRVVEEGKLEPAGEWRCGWWAPHWQAFVAALAESLGAVLAHDTVPTLSHRFSVALPVSVPPWPLASGSVACNYPVAEPVVEGLDAEDYGRVVWHDVAVTPAGLVGAGIDGLLGVVKGTGETLVEALDAAVGLAAKVSVPEKSFRWDAGRLVPVALVALARAGVAVDLPASPGAGTSDAPPSPRDTDAHAPSGTGVGGDGEPRTADHTVRTVGPPRSGDPGGEGDTHTGSAHREPPTHDHSRETGPSPVAP